MDYSLLVGVCKNINIQHTQGNSKYKIITSINFDEIYFIGIIDFLQIWNLKKKLESRVKSITIEKNSLSALPPSEYSERFVEFMSNNLVF